MGKTTGIEWCDATWNPWYGCTTVSPGCDHCYARRNWRLLGLKPGEVRKAADTTFYAPLKWKEPKRIFVCSLSDFLHPAADEWRWYALNIMAQCPQHTFIVVTKRPERIIQFIGHFVFDVSNIWMLVTAENQEQADKRIPELLRLRNYGNWPVLGVSIEPMLEPISLSKWIHPQDEEDAYICGVEPDWVIVGGESGKNARTCHPDWVRKVRDDCKAAGVPFWFKQWGEWAPKRIIGIGTKGYEWGTITADGIFYPETTPWNGHDDDGYGGEAVVVKVGKTRAGCLLDGRKWEETP